MADTYEDLFDIGDSLSFSEEFLKDTKNLGKLEDAAEGVEGAYEDLQDEAARDIELNATLKENITSEDVNNLVESIQDGVEDIAIGATLDADDEIMGQMLDLVNDLGLTAEEASDYLKLRFSVDVPPEAFQAMDELVSDSGAAGEAAANNMTLETTAEAGSIEAEGQDTYSDVIADVTSIPITGTAYPAGVESGQEPVTLTGSVDQVTYSVKTQTIPKSTSAGAVGVTTTSKGAGGGSNSPLQFKKGATGTRTGTGATKRGATPSRMSRPSSGSCFIAGTPVTMCGYQKAIEEVQVGDLVLSYNEKLGRNQYSVVLETMIHNVQETLYTIHIDSEKITSTGIHRFLVKHNDKRHWMPAAILTVGDQMLFADGTWHEITQIETEVKTTTVYNFEVSGTHNYYVGASQILAHNKGGGGGKNKKKGSGNEKKEVSRTEAATAENDIYNKVNATLEKLSKQYDKLDKVANRV